MAANETRTVLVEHDGLLELGPDARVVDRPEQARDIAFRGSALEIACGKPFTPPHRAGAESGGIALGELVQRPRIEPRVRIEHGLTEDLSSRALGKAGAPGLQIVAITARKSESSSASRASAAFHSRRRAPIGCARSCSKRASATGSRRPTRERARERARRAGLRSGAEASEASASPKSPPRRRERHASAAFQAERRRSHAARARGERSASVHSKGNPVRWNRTWVENAQPTAPSRASMKPTGKRWARQIPRARGPPRGGATRPRRRRSHLRRRRRNPPSRAPASGCLAIRGAA